MSDQGNNFKREVMEALDIVPANKLSGKAYKWAATNLPDEGKSNGIYSMSPTPMVDLDNLDHDKKKVSEVFGYTDETMDKLQKEFHKIVKSYKEDFHDNHESPKKSHFVWFFIKAASPELQFMIYMNSLAEICEKFENSIQKSAAKDILKSLRDLLKDLEKGESDDTE